jgi:hypothetical protein
MAKQVSAWQCDYCGMTSLHKSSVRRHELHTCQKAPRSCGTCQFYKKSEDGPWHICEGGKDLPLPLTQCDKWMEVTQ